MCITHGAVIYCRKTDFWSGKQVLILSRNTLRIGALKRTRTTIGNEILLKREFLLSSIRNARALSFQALSKLLSEGTHKRERADRFGTRF